MTRNYDTQAAVLTAFPTESKSISLLFGCNTVTSTQSPLNFRGCIHKTFIVITQSLVHRYSFIFMPLCFPSPAMKTKFRCVKCPRINQILEDDGCLRQAFDTLNPSLCKLNRCWEQVGTVYWNSFSSYITQLLFSASKGRCAFQQPVLLRGSNINIREIEYCI